ncbi:MAG: penicillin-binding protein 2 [Pseudomonadota bacterium]
MYLRTIDNEWFRMRLTGLVVITIAAFIVLFVRLVYLQVIVGEEMQRFSLNNRIRLQNLDPQRGLIFDRNGTLLVDNRPAFDLSIITKDAKPVDVTLSKLAHYTGIPIAELNKRYRKHRRVGAYTPIPLKQDIGRDMLATIEVHKFDLPGIVVNVKPRRHYIEAQNAAHLIGYLSEISADELRSENYTGRQPGDFIGKSGVEKLYDTYLTGEHGGQQVEVDATGRIVRVIKVVAAKPGNNIFLTLDHAVQIKAESLLHGSAGAAVAIDPNSGRILAMASSPSFNQNVFVDGMSTEDWQALISNPNHPMENKAIQGQYPPASTFKIVTAMAALEEDAIDAATTVRCPGYFTFGDRTFRCWKKTGHGTLEVVQAIAQSCDVFFYQAGVKLGVDRLAWHAKAFGLGSITGIGFENENSGLIPTAAWKLKRFGIPWQQGETLSIAIGQGYNLVTPLQMAVVVGAIGNGGARYRPLVVDAIKTPDGKTIFQELPELVGRINVSPVNLALVRQGLFEVVNGAHGTARGIRSKAYAISGKTGTAQLVSRQGDEDGDGAEDETGIKDHAWFVAYAPSEAPRIAVAVIVEHGEHGSSAAAPIAQEMIAAFLKPDAARQ